MRSAPLLAAIVALGCGTNRPDIPKELLEFDGGGGSSNYPAVGAPPYVVGSVIPNQSYQGWRNPKAANYDPAAFETISFGDYYDPAGTTYEILLINTSAIWCSACKIEHGGSGQSPSLNAHNAELAPKGLVIVSLLFEDGQSNPSEAQDLVNWTSTYETEFPMALDPEYQMKAFQPNKSLAPFNMIVDARTMQILATYAGDQAAEIWPFIEQELDEREAAGN
jgi:hypothetical protein